MSILAIIIRSTLSLILVVIELLMFVRVIVSFFGLNGGAVTDFIYAATETVVFPVRSLFDKMGWGRDIPIDLPFFVTFLIVGILSTVI